MQPSMRAAILSFLVYSVVGCGARQHTEAVASSSSSPHSEAAGTRYRRGDYVVYRYSGSYTPQPVTLREEVTEQNGNRLTVEVTLRRGDETRRWVQHLTDTPENQRDNVIDALEEVRSDGTRVALANRDNADLFRLFEGTFVIPDGRPTDVREADVTETIAGTPHRCHQRVGSNVWHGQRVEFRETECPEFLWTHASAEWRVAGSSSAASEPIYRVEVLATGHR